MDWGGDSEKFSFSLYIWQVAHKTDLKACKVTGKLYLKILKIFT